MMISRVALDRIVKSCGVMMRSLALVAIAGCALTAADTIYLALLKGASALAYLSPDGKVLATVPRWGSILTRWSSRRTANICTHPITGS